MKIHLLAFCLFFCQYSFAQEIVRSTLGSFGTSVDDKSILIQQTIGQPSATSFSSQQDGTALRQGFHQPYYYLITGKSSFMIKVFPNPNKGSFSFQADLSDSDFFEYRLVDPFGKIILNNTSWGNNIISIKLNQPISGIYCLQIFNKTKSSSFKIVVIN
jgi:hypothetical protein